jgi:hypothetical protein
MNDALRETCERWLDGELDEAAATALAATLARGGAEAEAFFAMLAWRGAIGAALDPTRADDVVRSFRERLAAEEDGGRFADRFRSRGVLASRGERGARPRRRAWAVAAALAAAALLAGWWTMATGRSGAAAAVMVVAAADARLGDAAIVPGAKLPADAQVVTGASGWALLRWPDGTEADLEPDTSLAVMGDGTVGLRRGGLRAAVRPRASDRPFTVATAAWRAIVLGTSLRIATDGADAELAVLSGRVHVEAHDGTAAGVVAAGSAGRVEAGRLVVAPIAADEVVLRAGAGRLVGDDWTLAQRDGHPVWRADRLLSRLLDGTHLADVHSYVAFRCWAEAGRDYVVWVRGRCLAGDARRTTHDLVLLACDGARVERSGRANEWREISGMRAAAINGFSYRADDWWVSGDEDLAAGGDGKPVRMRFDATGEQVLRLYAIEGPMEVEAIWLSTTKRERPAPDDAGPRTGFPR